VQIVYGKVFCLSTDLTARLRYVHAAVPEYSGTPYGVLRVHFLGV
jgi:hypothetical protein